MVNLRYHIVSLVAVFLALALGVVLGAGPLQNQVKRISDGENLQERLSSTESELEATVSDNSQYGEYINAVGSQLLPGTLAGQEIVTVSLPGANVEDVDTIVRALDEADAVVVGNVQLTDNWISLGQREYRDTLSAPIATHLKKKAQSDTADAVLSQSLKEVLTLTGGEPELMRQILTDEATPLIEPGTLPEQTATAAVIIGGRDTLVVTEDPDSDDERGDVSIQAVLSLANTLGELPGGAVAVGRAQVEADFISQLRTESAQIATVDQIGSQMAPLNVALALVSGGTGRYGQGMDALEAVAPLPTGE